ncbi:MAG: acetyl-CoA carboxylase, biotin carboxyl carrier protein [Hyphomicrobiales bacterium]|nr:acetyl-CoA carboxylase, biotin carboxyl carrier protein [Hyphomicrobiales bacterium]
MTRSEFEHLELEIGDVKLTLSKRAPSSAPATAERSPRPAPPSVSAAEAPQSSEAATASPIESSMAITAPMLGRFYARPEPGAAPFVGVGSEVTPETTVALIEVMKTFNSVQAGVTGIIAEVCVDDAQLVEFGQPLYRVQPRG